MNKVVISVLVVVIVLAGLWFFLGEKGVYEEPALPDDLEEYLEFVKEDLAGRLGVPYDNVTLANYEAREFSDTSLGLPQPDEVYAQVITPGYIIDLEAAGETYRYHVGGGVVIFAE